MNVVVELLMVRVLVMVSVAVLLMVSGEYGGCAVDSEW